MTKKRSTEQQIEDLTNQLLEVTQQLNNLRLQVRREREREEAQTARQTSRANNNRRGLQIGDRVVILNDYQNLRGVEGTVIRLSTTFVTIRTDTGREITRGKQNIQRIETKE